MDLGSVLKIFLGLQISALFPEAYSYIGTGGISILYSRRLFLIDSYVLFQIMSVR